MFRPGRGAQPKRKHNALPVDATLEKLTQVNGSLRDELHELTKALEDQLVRMKEKRERQMYSYKNRQGDSEQQLKEKAVKAQ